MSGLPILDLVVGIIFIFFLLSIICSSAVELWVSIRSTRAKLLEQWLKRIFDLPALDSNGAPKLNAAGKPVSVGQEIMDHCMVTALAKTGKSTSYIDAKNFVSALLDKITLSPAAPGANNFQIPPSNLTGYITSIKNSTLISGELKRTILLYANEASQAAAAQITNKITTEIKSELDHFRDRLENWYDTNSNRLTGAFKRKKVMPATIILATIITVALNTDTIEISKYLYNNKGASKELAATAMNTYKNYEKRLDTLSKVAPDTAAVNVLSENTRQLKEDIDSLQALDLPMGWKATNVKDFKTFRVYFFQWKHIFGWLATILAICMGAPFWFDILNKIANMRGAGPKPVVADDSSKK